MTLVIPRVSWKRFDPASLSFFSLFIGRYLHLNVLLNLGIMLRANRRNIVDHQFPTLLHVALALCAPCCMLLNAAGSCCAKFEIGQTFSYAQSDATSQYCWANNVGSFCVCLHLVLVPLIVYTKAQCDSYL